jgi:hypothetical protein
MGGCMGEAGQTQAAPLILFGAEEREAGTKGRSASLRPISPGWWNLQLLVD